jgi:hypothetical protein
MPRLEVLEDRTLLSIDLLGQPSPDWLAVGPNPILKGAAEGLSVQIGDSTEADPASGAVTAILVSPDDPKTIYIGTTNGGVWKTSNADEIGHNPTWTPVTDSFGSLSIGALAVDPDQHNVLYAGSGSVSSDHLNGPTIGLLKSTDGGANWQVVPGDDDMKNGRISSILPLNHTGPDGSEEDDVLIAGSNGAFLNTQAGEVGSRWVRLSSDSLPDGNLPGLEVSSMVADPGHPGRVYAGVPGKGVYRSDQYGSLNSWHLVAGNSDITDAPSAIRTILTVSPVAPDFAVYSATITPLSGRPGWGLSHIYQSTDGGPTGRPCR